MIFTARTGRLRWLAGSTIRWPIAPDSPLRRSKTTLARWKNRFVRVNFWTFITVLELLSEFLNFHQSSGFESDHSFRQHLNILGGGKDVTKVDMLKKWTRMHWKLGWRMMTLPQRMIQRNRCHDQQENRQWRWKVHL